MARTRPDQQSDQPDPVVIGDGPSLGSGEGLKQNATSRNERVSRRAYQRFEERGGEHGRDLEDWLEAERELMDLDEER
jgi:hypothetical protein